MRLAFYMNAGNQTWTHACVADTLLTDLPPQPQLCYLIGEETRVLREGGPYLALHISVTIVLIFSV